MRNRLLSTAVSAAMLGCGAAAFAGTGLGDAGANAEFRVSGATAFSDTLRALLTQNIAANPCVIDGDFKLYLATNTANAGLASDNFAVSCTLRAGSAFQTNVSAAGGPAAGDEVEVYKVDTGSGDGVRPFDVAATPITVTFIDPAAATGANCTTGNLTADDTSEFVTPLGANAGAGTPSVVRCTGMATGDGRNRTDGLSLGTSDVEPALFGVTSIPDAQGAASLIWGVPVSIDLRDALQAFQFPTASVCHPSNAAYNSQATHPADGSAMVEFDGVTPVTNRESEACQPSLTREQLASVLNGQFFNWGLMTNANGDSLLGVATAAGLGPRGGDSTVYVCRRREGSGTEASYEAIFMRQRCEAGVTGMAIPFNNVSAGGDPFNAITCPGFAGDVDPDGDNVVCPGGVPAGDLFSPSNRIFAGRGTGDVRECLTLHSQSDVVAGDGTWAVGIFSTENRPNDANEGAVSAFGGANYPNRRYRHIKISGYIGSTYNAALGLYPYFSEVSLQTHNSAEGPQSKSLRDAAVTGFVTSLSNPAVLASLNQDQTWGNGGSLAAMDTVGETYANAGTTGITGDPNIFPLTAAEVRANPLIPLSKHNTGALNNCQEPTHQGGFQLLGTNLKTDSQSKTDAQVISAPARP